MYQKIEAPATPVVEQEPRVTETDVPEYIIDRVMDDMWDRTTDLGLIHDPIFARAD